MVVGVITSLWIRTCQMFLFDIWPTISTEVVELKKRKDCSGNCSFPVGYMLRNWIRKRYVGVYYKDDLNKVSDVDIGYLANYSHRSCRAEEEKRLFRKLFFPCWLLAVWVSEWLGLLGSGLRHARCFYLGYLANHFYRSCRAEEEKRLFEQLFLTCWIYAQQSWIRKRYAGVYYMDDLNKVSGMDIGSLGFRMVRALDYDMPDVFV